MPPSRQQLGRPQRASAAGDRGHPCRWSGSRHNSPHV